MTIFEVRFPDNVFRIPIDKPGLTREEVVDDIMSAIRQYVWEHVECVNGKMPSAAVPTPGQVGGSPTSIPRFRELTADDL